jgi:hypothetical protein
MRGWSELWRHFLATMADQPVAIVLAVWIGLALVAVMAIEGFLLNLFPASVLARFLEKMPERKRKSAAPPPAQAAETAPPPKN